MVTVPSRRIPSCLTWRRSWAIALVTAAMGAVAHPADAQITTEALIGESVSQPESPRYSDVAEAIKRYVNGDYLAARTYLEQATEKDKTLPPVAVLLAKLHLLSGKGTAVRAALEDSVNEAPDDPEPYLILGEDALSGGRTIEADALFGKAVSLMQDYNINPKRKRSFVIRSYRGSAAIAQRRRKWDQAQSDLTEWIKVDDKNAAAHLSMGQVLFMLDKPREALESFKKAKSLNDKVAHPYVSAGAMYERKGDHSQALRYFEGAYKDEQSETAAVQYAQSLLKSGDTAKAEAILKAGRASFPDSLNVVLLSGVGARMAGDLDAAEQHFAQALVLSPRNRDVLGQISQLLIEKGDNASKIRAADFAATNAQINTNNADVTVTLAWVLYQNGQAQRATAALRQGLQQGKLASDTSLLVAKMLIQSEQQEQAKILIQKALEDETGIFVKRAEAEELLRTL